MFIYGGWFPYEYGYWRLEYMTWKKGKNYLIRTVTHIDVGRLKSVTEHEIFLDNASWIADTGRFMDALKDGLEKQDNSEIEPFPKGEVIIGRGSIIDAVEYKHKLPDKQK